MRTQRRKGLLLRWSKRTQSAGSWQQDPKTCQNTAEKIDGGETSEKDYSEVALISMTFAARYTICDSCSRRSSSIRLVGPMTLIAP